MKVSRVLGLLPCPVMGGDVIRVDGEHPADCASKGGPWLYR